MIETLREADLVAARDEETGVSGTFPITGVSARQANDLLWLHLEREDGATSRMGVTTGHPMFTVGQGWLTAGELAAGDRIRNANLHDLMVLSFELDQTPQRVHNLEIAEAHTYFVGDLEAWGHNAWYNLERYRPLLPWGCNGAARDPETGRFTPQKYVEEGNMGDAAAGVLTGLADDNSGLCPNNPAGRKGNTIGSILRKLIDFN